MVILILNLRKTNSIEPIYQKMHVNYMYLENKISFKFLPSARCNVLKPFSSLLTNKKDVLVVFVMTKYISSLLWHIFFYIKVIG